MDMRGIVRAALLIAAAAGAVCLSGCSKKRAQGAGAEAPDTLSAAAATAATSATYGALTDARDGKTYKTVKMPDGETWTAENLNYRADGSWCYENKESNCEKYGRLYDWETARTVCPAGFHLPSYQEWEALEEAVGGGDKRVRGLTDDFFVHKSPDKALNAKHGWNAYANGESGNGADIYGFSALPGGARYYSYRGGEFDHVGNAGFWWTVSENDDFYPLYYFLGYDPDPNPYNGSKRHGYSVRCVQNRSYAAEEPRGAEQAAEADTTRFTDPRDGRVYRAAKIGGKTWFAENLNYKAVPSWCYGNDTSNCGKYGRLYDWNTARSACPAGWHLPSVREWDILAKAAGGEKNMGDYVFDAYWSGAGRRLKARSGWNDYGGKSGNGVGDYGFSALPGGSGGAHDYFFNAGYHGAWWTATENLNGGAHYRYMDYNSDRVSERQTHTPGYIFSARCVMDESETGRAKPQAEKNAVYFTDSRDNRKYRYVEIGGRKWFAENLNYKADGSWCYNDDSSYCDKYGRLYDWNTADTVCPSGWYLPSRQDWDNLWQAAEGVGAPDSGNNVRKKLKAKSGWNGDETGKNRNGTDDYGFSALPGGNRHHSGGFGNAGDYGFWWSATEYGGYNAYSRFIDYSDAYVDELALNITYGFSVRCIQKGGDAAEKAFKERMEAARKEMRAQKRKEAQQRIGDDPAYFADPRDGWKYRAVEIGGKRWFAENLNYAPQTGKAWCYDDDSSYCDKYGRLYDWNTANTVCPSGWHLPSRRDWDDLGKAAGGERAPNGESSADWLGAGKKLKAKSGWGFIEYDGIGYNGTDDYGFSALPGGQRYGGGGFDGAGSRGRWWTSAEHDSGHAYRRTMQDHNDDVREYYEYKSHGFSVRCVQNK